ncbi:hypothetical protein RI129_003637 [Pyrocoelia pectoralis]|uniref:Fanconi anemia group M protein n=1 Tax=Pyrocoelia pectoralis TaxID=417401 RepID=A0AAN7VHA5_9COLE
MSVPKETIGITELSLNIETEGFDLQAGTTWIYPTNYPCRDYQYAIIQEALLKNTMVSLPTGLGKTFIAAVVMYNYYRWYPRGKVIFMAPTKPLVKQQVDACYNVMAIPKEVTAELTGTKAQESRKDIWNEKRVFFITPQVLQNDLNILTNFGSKIKCLVIDEAHKAKGNHAYCEVIRKLTVQNKYFRVLALSATPGNSIKDVAEVINNLLINHLEIRTDDSPDVLPYVFERSLETVVVPLGDKLQQVKDSYMPILEKYTKVLMQNKILTGNCSTLTKGKIFMTMKFYQEQNKQNRDKNYSENMRYLNICHTLYYAFELLLRHGLRSFLLFFQDRIEKTMLHENVLLKNIIVDIEEYMGPLINIESLPDGSITGIPDTVKFGHPKFYKLRDVTCEHFKQQNNSETRVIIFCEYRETVMEAYGILSLSQPLIKPRIFMGKTSITQKQQINVIKSFRDGTCNTLISTCIGEEGLDVGSVDLIICFDINNKSPIRMIQRMGRTGRKREGRTLKECLIQKQNLSNHILHYKSFTNELYADNPRMIPPDIEPKCNKIFITIKNENDRKVSKSKSKNIKDIFKMISEGQKHSTDTNEAKLIDIIDIPDKLPDTETFWNCGGLISKSRANTIAFSRKLNKLRTLQPIGFIRHSNKTKMMVSLLEKCDSSKYDLPITQNPDEDVTDTKEVIDNCVTENNDLNNNCKLCNNLFDCTQYYSTFNLSFNISDWNEPDACIYNTINCTSLALYEKALNECKTETMKVDTVDVVTINNDNESDILERENIEDTMGLVNSPFKLPKSINNVLKMLDSTIPNVPLTGLESENNKVENKEGSDLNFSINLEGFDSVEFTQLQELKLAREKTPEHDLNEGLDFFNISTLEDIFEDTHNMAQSINLSVSQVSNSTIIYTPEKVRPNDSCSIIESPILSASKKACYPSTGVNRRTSAIDSDDVVDTSIISPILSSRSKIKSKSKLSDRDNYLKEQGRQFNKSSSNLPSTTPVNTKQDLHEILDDSILDMFYNDTFEESSQKKITDKKSEENTQYQKKCDVSTNRKIENVTTIQNEQIVDSAMRSDSNKSAELLKIVNSSSDTVKTRDWENNIWNFCMDSDVSINYEETCTKKSDTADGKTTKNVCGISKGIENPSTPNKVIDIVSDQSDDFINSPTKSPSLIMSQRVLHRSQLNSNEKGKKTPQLKENPKMGTQGTSESNEVHRRENDKNINLDESMDTFGKHASPVLNKSPMIISNKFKTNKVSKKLQFSDDDDDFELEPRQTSSWIYPKNRNIQSGTSSNKRTSLQNVAKCKSKNQEMQKCPYVELEADVSGTHSDISESDGDGSFEKSFVDDETQDIANTTMMHVKYLQSVRTVNTNRGNFKIPQLPVSNINVYSQIDVDNEMENAYINDSFCVSTQEDELYNSPEDMSELDIAELLLEKQRKKKKSKVQAKTMKRRRIVESSSDSD